jgi:hypothetical protein
MEEVWKIVPSKSGLAASSIGRVRLIGCYRSMPNGGIREYRPKPTFGVRSRSSKTARHVYMGFYNKSIGNIKVHRVVCEAFHGPAPFDRAVVIHIDENAENNIFTNLRWGTQKENLNMPKFIEYCKSRTGENSPTTKGRKKVF